METPLSALTEEERALAMERYLTIQPFLDEGVSLSRIAQSRSQTLRTLRRWVARYRREGLTGLARKERADHSQRRKLTPEMQKLVEGLALQKPPLSAAFIHRKVCHLAQSRGEPLPSYSLVYAIVRQLPNALTTLAHQGSKAYAETFDLVYRREAGGPNLIWQADHTLLDILLVLEGKEPARPWLTTIIDDYSRAIAGYFLSFDPPCALHTSLALRQAIWRKEDARWHICGIPQTLYSDNGSDFTSHHLEQVCIDLKIRMAHSIPGKPRGRGRIERFFESLNQMLLCELPGFTPSKGSMRGKPQLTLRDLDTCFREFLLDFYHLREHGDTKWSPHTRWEAGGFLPYMPESLEQLDLLLLTVPKSRKVRSDGIWFLGMRYIDPTLAAYVGEEVLLRYDPRDIAEVRIFYQNRFLCRAVCQELAGDTVPLREIMRARNHRRKELRQTLQDRQRTVDTLLKLRQWAPIASEEPLTKPPSTSETKPQELQNLRQTPRLKRYINE